MKKEFDRTQYVKCPQIDVPGAVALAAGLLKLVPKNATPDEKKAARKVRACVVTLQAAWKERDRKLGVRSPVDPRAADLAVDRAWGVGYGRLDSLAGLPQDIYPRAKRAAKLRDSLFPNGLSFLKWSYPSEWAESEKLLDRITEENLEPEFEELAGADVMAELRRTHAEYTVAVHNVMAGANDKAPSDLTTPLRALSKAIGTYSTLLTVSVDEDDVASVARALAALRPIDVYRAQQARRGRDADGEEEVLPEPSPETPLEDVPE